MLLGILAALLKVVGAIPHKRRGSGRSDLGPFQTVGRVGTGGQGSVQVMLHHPVLFIIHHSDGARNHREEFSTDSGEVSIEIVGVGDSIDIPAFKTLTDSLFRITTSAGLHP